MYNQQRFSFGVPVIFGGSIRSLFLCQHGPNGEVSPSEERRSDVSRADSISWGCLVALRAIDCVTTCQSVQTPSCWTGLFLGARNQK